MYGTSSSQYSARFRTRDTPDTINSVNAAEGSESGVPTSSAAATNIFKDLEDTLASNSEEYFDMETSESAQEPQATTYIYVDSDGVVKQKIVRPTSRIFGRFQQRPEQLGRADLIDDIIKTEVENRIAEIIKRGDILPAMSEPTKPVAEPIDKSVAEPIDSAQNLKEYITHDLTKLREPNYYVPFFNEELFATNDCKTCLHNKNLNIMVELAGILSEDPKMYPFGYQSAASIGRLSIKPMKFNWKSEDGSEGYAIGILSTSLPNSTVDKNKYTIYCITFSSWMATRDNQAINFIDIELPMTLTFVGTCETD